MESRSARSAVNGAVAGLIATGAMTVAMVALDRLLPGRPEQHGGGLPPRKIAMGLARKVGVAHQMNRAQRSLLTWANHFVYGAGVALLYPFTAQRLPGPGPLKGVVHGLGVWAGSYAGWLPAMGILPPPQRQSWRWNTMVVASHLVWGGTLGWLAEPRGIAAPTPSHALPEQRPAGATPANPVSAQSI